MLAFGAVFLAFLAAVMYAGFTYDPKPPQVTVFCEGDYRIFIRGDQFDVLFSEECERENVRPPLLGA